VGDRDGGGDVTVTVTETVAVGPAFGGPGQDGVRDGSGARESPRMESSRARAGVTVAWSTSPQAMATARCERSSPGKPAAIR